MRALGGILAALILALQFPLWLGKGGWVRVWEVDRQLEEQIARNGGLEARNGSLAAEVNDLKRGLDAVEERARGGGGDGEGRSGAVGARIRAARA